MFGSYVGDFDVVVEFGFVGVEDGFGGGVFNIVLCFGNSGFGLDFGDFVFLFIFVFGFIDVIFELGFGDVDMGLVSSIFVSFFV